MNTFAGSLLDVCWIVYKHPIRLRTSWRRQVFVVFSRDGSQVPVCPAESQELSCRPAVSRA